MSNINELVLLSEERLSNAHAATLPLPTSKDALKRFNGNKKMAADYRRMSLDWHKQATEHMYQALKVSNQYGKDAANIYAKYAKTNILKD